MIGQNSLLKMQKFQLMAEISQEIVIFFGKSGNIVDCNRKAMEELGYDRDISQISITEIFREAIRMEDNQVSLQMKYQDKALETVAYRKNQTCFPVNLKISVKEDKKNYLGICCAINISDRRQLLSDIKYLKNEIKSYKQDRNEFIANITHELRTPVNGIMGFTEGLMETELLPKQIETVNIIHRCCVNMNTIINDLLDYTKFANKKMVLEHIDFNFRNFIDDIVELNVTKINEKGLKLLVNVADDVPVKVIGDEFRLAQILNNLFANAVKFTSIGQIALEVVKTAQTEDEVELFFMVMDTGIGISMEDMDKLFISFSQVDGSITRRFGGTGLGLSICKMLVEAMHGSIEVESDKGKGSTFSFTVRLGLPEMSDSMEDDEIQEEEPDTGMFITSSIDGISNIPEGDYISRMIEEAGSQINTVSDHEESHREVIGYVLNAMEKLSLSIEMESWEKAEELAEYIKNMIPNDHKELNKKAFRLLLAVRKEDHDTSLMLNNELKTIICEVVGWKM
ncbi:MAG TPA: ATP-binding protein [Mobilitalea sp.]|nr:ATP-binding protein [Mobilitalea sp.]